MCGSSAFDDALCSLGEDPDTFTANPTADELLAAITMLAPPQLQENNDLLSPGSAAIDALQAFNFDEYLQVFGSFVPPPVAGEPAASGTRSVTVTLTVPHNSPVETSSSESIESPSPLPSFYAATPSPVSATEPSPPPHQTKHQPYVPPRGAANAAGRRVGGNWKVPLAVSRLASPIPAAPLRPSRQPCNASPTLQPLIIPNIIVVILQLTGTPASLAPRSCNPDSSSLSHHACTCIPSHHLVLLPVPICFRHRYLLALICFALILSYLFLSLLSPLLSFSHVHPRVSLRSGLLLVFTDGLGPARRARIRRLFTSTKLGQRKPRSPLYIHSQPLQADLPYA